jgi:phenylpropionate dioxygenase-like ring-hydroxylating dioxygenase large terminal subunit
MAGTSLHPQFTRTDPEDALKRAWTLPSDWYTDPAIFQREQERIFERSWQYVGPASRVERPGSFFSTQIGRVPVVVVRTKSGDLAAHVNVCPHRGNLVAHGEGDRRLLQCGYHGWTFELDGALRNAPRSETECGFDKSGLGLRPVRLETWGPLMFVNLDIGAEPLLETIGGLVDLAEERGFDLDRHPLRASREFTIATNWKVTLDNNTECYHCSTVHPEFSRKYHVDAENYAISAFPKAFSHISPTKSAEDRANDTKWTDFHLSYAWPNFMVSARGNDYFYTYTYIPVDPTTTIQRNDFFFPHDWTGQEMEEALTDIEQIMREDWTMFEQVQVGLASGMLPHGFLLADNEALLRQLQRLIYDTLAID